MRTHTERASSDFSEVDVPELARRIRAATRYYAPGSMLEELSEQIANGLVAEPNLQQGAIWQRLVTQANSIALYVAKEAGLSEIAISVGTYMVGPDMLSEYARRMRTPGADSTLVRSYVVAAAIKWGADCGHALWQSYYMQELARQRHISSFTKRGFVAMLLVSAFCTYVARSMLKLTEWLFLGMLASAVLPWCIVWLFRWISAYLPNHDLEQRRFSARVNARYAGQFLELLEL